MILRADGITKWYDYRKVLSSATLRAEPGVVSYLVGRNGCGKSTLLRVAAGEIAADGGTVTFKGKSYLRPHWPVLASLGLFFLPDREMLTPKRTVQSHLDSMSRRFGKAGITSAIDALQLAPFLPARCVELSTGERRRVEIAVALARRPDCLLADEPYRNIDPNDRLLIAAALRGLASRGCAVVVTGHEVEDLFESADLITWCTDGTTYEIGTPAEALDHWRFTSKYLGELRLERLRGGLKLSGESPRTP